MSINIVRLPLSRIAVATTIVVAIASSVVAQASDFAQPDRNGDYFRNYAPIQAKRPLNSPGSLWQVVSPKLNCRSSVGSHSQVERQFKRGAVLQVNIGRGGSDEVLVNAIDQRGKPWMFVRSELGTDYNCFVRANSLYIKPYKR